MLLAGAGVFRMKSTNPECLLAAFLGLWSTTGGSLVSGRNMPLMKFDELENPMKVLGRPVLRGRPSGSPDPTRVVRFDLLMSPAGCWWCCTKTVVSRWTRMPSELEDMMVVFGNGYQGNQRWKR